MSTATEKDIKELREEYASLKSDLSEMSETLSSLARDGLAEGRDRVRGAARGAARRSRKQARDAWDAVESEVEERPITSLAVALGIGFVLGKMLSR